MALTAAQIRKRLKDRGLTYGQVGALVDPPLSKTIISRNIKKVAGHMSARARYAIALALDATVEEVYGAGPAGASRQMVELGS